MSAFLFVPASRLDLVAKAYRCGADNIIIDLEDGIHGLDKHTIRQDIKSFCQTWSWHDFDRIWLRTVSTRHNEFDHDLALIKPFFGVVLPKVKNEYDIKVARDANKPILAMIECVEGVMNLPQIAQSQGLWGLTFGCLDLAMSLGVVANSPSGDMLFDKIRMDILLHSRLNQLNPPIETIFTDINDDVGLSYRVAKWKNLGFGGQLLIHPKQVAIVKAHQTDPARLDFAKKVHAHHQATGQAVFTIDGQMVDLPIIDWAYRQVAMLT